MQKCFVALGDRVWQRVSGIPMGFSCSPLWCNLYLLYYETQFIQRLASLGRTDLMQRFQFAFRYIDDLCWINNGVPEEFLDPQQPRRQDNPFWIYPLNVLEIKCEVSEFALDNSKRGVHAHFMNLDIQINWKSGDSGSYELCKYDKRRQLPFAYTQYIKFASNRPVNQSYGIAISQTVPIIYLSSTMELALQEIQLLIDVMTQNGFNKNQVRTRITKFLCQGSFPGAKFSINDLIVNIRYLFHLPCSSIGLVK